MAACVVRFSNPGRDRRFVSSFSISVLRQAMRHSGVASITIGSTFRPPGEQARVMYDNVFAQLVKDPGSTRSMYGGRPGEPVEAIARQDLQRAHVGLRDGFDPNQQLPLRSHSIDSMTRAIECLEERQGAGCVSHHQLRTPLLDVLDVGANTLQPHGQLATFIRTLTELSVVKRVGLPKGSKKYSPKHFVETATAIHLEIIQPDAVERWNRTA